MNSAVWHHAASEIWEVIADKLSAAGWSWSCAQPSILAGKRCREIRLRRWSVGTT